MVITRWTSRAGWARTMALAPRLELDQAFVRLIIAGSVLIYVSWGAFAFTPAVLALRSVWLVAGFFAFAVAMILWILARPQDALPLRVLGIIADIGAITYYILVAGEAGATVVGVYLFLVLGNGFRYGRLYLYLSQTAALLGFGFVLSASDFWSRHAIFGAGWFIALIILPVYVGRLAQHLVAAQRRAEQELKECQQRERGKS